jgi:hypothetical protein
MRIIFLLATFFFCVTAKSQTILSPGIGNYSQSTALSNSSRLHDSLTAPKWFFRTYRGISTSVSFFKGGHASVFSAPMGLQLNRRLNNNLYAFANATIAPSYISISPSFVTGGFSKNFSGNNSRQNSFGLYPAVSVGLMYVNDAKTFSISGSISAERSTYPLLPYYPNNTPFIPAGR